MCAATAGKQGKRVLLLDHARKSGEKIRISGGGRCNFTNIHCNHTHFLSSNQHFAKSALARFTPHDFIAMVEKHGIAYHEKTLGQLFCDGSSQQIIDMLLAECAAGNVQIMLETAVEAIEAGYHIGTSQGRFSAPSLVVATGGLSIPKMGATDLGYRIAQQFAVPITPRSAALVPFTMSEEWLQRYKPLAGVTIEDCTVSCGKRTFREAMLFTHKGLSGPAILQISSYWQAGDSITLNLLPNDDIFEILTTARSEHARQDIQTVLSHHIPRRLTLALLDELSLSGRMADLPNASLRLLADHIHCWQLTPSGTEGYRTAEVTLGGISTEALSSKTMACTQVNNLYFIGEVVDVTGHLGGHNFQWAWASGYSAGLAL